MGKLRAYGNSLNAEAAIAFIKSFLESEAEGHGFADSDADLIG